MTTVASGRCTSPPACVDSAIGKKPMAATSAVVNTGRITATAPSMNGSGSPRARRPLDLARGHHAVEHRDAAQRDEADRRRQRERHAAQAEPDDAADERQRHAGEHRRHRAQLAEHEEQHGEDDPERHRHHDEQAILGAIEVGELPRPLEVIAGRQLHRRLDAPPALVGVATRSRPRTLASTSTRRSSPSRKIVAGPSRSSMLASCDNGTSVPLAPPTSKSPMACGSGAVGGMSTVTSKRCAPSNTLPAVTPARAADDRVEHVGGGDAVAGHARAIDAHVEERQAEHALHAQVAGALQRPDGVGDLIGQRLQRRQIGAEHLDRQIGLGARQELIDAIFDRLAHRDEGGRHLALDGLLHDLAEVVDVVRRLPLRLRRQRHVDLDLVEADRIGRHLGAPGARHDRLRLGEARQHRLGLLPQAHRLLQADRRQPLDVEGEGALVDARHELGAEAAWRSAWSPRRMRADDDESGSGRAITRTRRRR